jgi:hypothetical protein
MLAFVAFAVATGLAVALLIQPSDAPSTPSSPRRAYPPPVVYTTPTATPTALANGYMPEPISISTEVVTIETSEYVDILTDVQSALTEGDEAALTSMAPFEIILNPVGSEGHTVNRLEIPDGLSSTLEAALDSVSPLVQGYFFSPGDVASIGCLEMVVYPFDNHVTFPTSEPWSEPMPQATNPPTMYIDASAWQFCEEDGEWFWVRWWFGGYYETLYTIARITEESTYYVIRP